MLARIKTLGWAWLDKITSADLTAVDANIENALDKRAGQIDTLGSVVTSSGSGRIVPTSAVGADANTSYTIATSGLILKPGALTGDRTYTWLNTGAVANDVVTVVATAGFDIMINNAAAAQIAVVGPNGAAWADITYSGSAWTLLRQGPRVSTADGNAVAVARMWALQ